MKILVLSGKYITPDGSTAQRFVHERNLVYQNSGLDVTVLNLSAVADYEIDGLHVICFATYAEEVNQKYDILVMHQANLRHHYRFLKKYGDRFPHFVFIYHGYEILRCKKAYPKPYKYNSSCLKNTAQDIYDIFRLSIWRHYLPKVRYKSHYAFVSRWMMEQFLQSTKLPYSFIDGAYDIIYNGIGSIFERTVYDCATPKQYDFITIRHTIDTSKFCLDYINALANANPYRSFMIVGRGEYFSHYKKADNITWENRILDHQQVVDKLQTARCALMPTRTDAQGLMVCEMASIGMPVITSDIPVCHEVFDGFSNVALIKNDDVSVDLTAILADLERNEPYQTYGKYYSKNTGEKEVEMLRAIVASDENEGMSVP